jgi:membrane-associated phospholipid phosphatase
VQGQGPLLVTAAIAVAVTGLTSAVLRLIRFTAPSPERVAGEVEAAVETAVERTGLPGLLARRLRPLEATGVGLTVALLAIVAAVAVFGAMAILGTRTRLWVVDATGAAWGSSHAGPVSTRVLELITTLGGTSFAFPVTTAAVAVMWLRRARPGPPLFLIAVVLGQSLVHNGVKLLVHRQRPPVPPLTGWEGFSFPSGHAATATALFAALALLLSRGRSRPVAIALGSAAAGLAAMVASSRVLLGVHWVTDVTAGVALGFLWFVACALAFGGRRLRLAVDSEPPPARTAAAAEHPDDPDSRPPRVAIKRQGR